MSTVEEEQHPPQVSVKHHVVMKFRERREHFSLYATEPDALYQEMVEIPIDVWFKMDKPEHVKVVIQPHYE
jgi:hypothetical protein